MFVLNLMEPENNSNSTVNVYTVFLDVTGYNWNN